MNILIISLSMVYGASDLNIKSTYGDRMDQWSFQSKRNAKTQNMNLTLYAITPKLLYANISYKNMFKGFNYRVSLQGTPHGGNFSLTLNLPKTKRTGMSLGMHNKDIWQHTSISYHKHRISNYLIWSDTTQAIKGQCSITKKLSDTWLQLQANYQTNQWEQTSLTLAISKRGTNKNFSLSMSTPLADDSLTVKTSYKARGWRIGTSISIDA